MNDDLTKELESVTIDVVVKENGIDQAIGGLKKLLATPLIEIKTEEDYNKYKELKNTFEMTQNGELIGVVPNLKRFVNAIESKISVLATLRELSSQSVTFKNNIDKRLKDYIANKFNYAVINEWNENVATIPTHTQEVLVIYTFDNFKAKVDSAVKGMSSEEKKLEKLALVAKDFKEHIELKDQEIGLLNKAIEARVKPIYHSEIKALTSLNHDLVWNLSLLDDFVAKKDALEKAEAVKRQVNAVKAVVEDPTYLKPAEVDAPALNRRVIYFEDDLKAELAEFFTKKFTSEKYEDGYKVTRG